MGRINLKSEKSSVKKYRTILVKVPHLTDFCELRLSRNGKLLASGSLVKVSLLRRFYESRFQPVQLEIFSDNETA